MINNTQYYSLFEQIARSVKAIRHTDDHKVFFRTPDEPNEKNMRPDSIYMIMQFPRYGYVDNDADNIIEMFQGGYYLLKPVTDKENFTAQQAAIESCKNAAQDVNALLLKLRKTFVSGTGPKIKYFSPRECKGEDVGLMLANSFGVYWDISIGEPNALEFVASKYDMDIVNAITF